MNESVEVVKTGALRSLPTKERGDRGAQREKCRRLDMTLIVLSCRSRKVSPGDATSVSSKAFLLRIDSLVTRDKEVGKGKRMP